MPFVHCYLSFLRNVKCLCSLIIHCLFVFLFPSVCFLFSYFQLRMRVSVVVLIACLLLTWEKCPPAAPAHTFTFPPPPLLTADCFTVIFVNYPHFSLAVTLILSWSDLFSHLLTFSLFFVEFSPFLSCFLYNFLLVDIIFHLISFNFSFIFLSCVFYLSVLLSPYQSHPVRVFVVFPPFRM